MHARVCAVATYRLLALQRDARRVAVKAVGARGQGGGRHRYCGGGGQVAAASLAAARAILATFEKIPS